MNLARLSFLALSLPLVAMACASPTTSDDSAAASQDMTAAWLQSNIPAGSALEGKVLALMNDSTMNESTFVSECSFSETQAANLLAYRRGDDAVAISDNQSFNTLAEIDAVPFTDATFWANTVRCAILHTPGPGVCLPGDHAPIIVELVVDESGSMAGDKWEATRDSILALYDKFYAAADVNTFVGTQLFDDTPTTKVSPKAMNADQHDDLVSLVDKPSPHGGGTGLEKALTAAYNTIDHVPGASAPGVQRIVVLLSDGAPSGGDVEKQASIDLVAQAHAAGVQLYAVGIGSFPTDSPGSYDPAFMGQLALAGGTAPASCDPLSTDLTSICHVQITPGDDVTALESDLTGALDTIRATMTATSTCP